MNTLTIIRGLPGSGKSTLAKQLLQGMGTQITVHLEADQYFMVDGVYKFDRNKLMAAHEWCLRETSDMLYYNKNVIVSNTFTTMREMRPYFECAQVLNRPVNVITCQGNFGSIHDVPDETLKKMRARFDYQCVEELYERVLS